MKKEIKVTLTAREYLDQLQDIDINIEQEKDKLKTMRIDATGSKGIDYTKDRVMISPSDRLCGDVCDIITVDKKVTEKINRFLDAKEQIIDQIRGLHNPIYNQILYKVYVEYKSLKRASFEMHRSYAFVRDKHKDALQAFEETYPELYWLV